MSWAVERLAVVLHPQLTCGEAASVTAILVGGLRPRTFADPILDAHGRRHSAPTRSLVVLSSATGGQLQSLAEELVDSQLDHVCFTHLGQQLNNRYEEYERRIHESGSKLDVIGVAVCGPEDQVRQMTRRCSLYKSGR